MIRTRISVILIASAIALGGCATLRDNPCAYADATRELLHAQETEVAATVSDTAKREALLGSIRVTLAALNKRCPVPT